MIINVPISIGELYDKITILEIKSSIIKNEYALHNIKKELMLLKAISKQYLIDNTFIEDLYNTNSKIWNIEDSIRIKYKKEEYDEEFIKLAQEVHELNDKRGRIKKEINIKYNSDIIEEKFHKS